LDIIGQAELTSSFGWLKGDYEHQGAFTIDAGISYPVYVMVS